VQPIYSIHLSTAKSWRGGENQVWLLARGLISRGQRVLVLAPHNAPLLERCRQSGVPIGTIHPSGELDFVAAARLTRLLKREKPQVLHAHDGHAVLPAKFAAWFRPRASLKFVAHRRTVFPLKGRWKYQGRVDRIVAISAAVRDRLLADGIPESSIRVVFSGLEFPEMTRGGLDGQALRQQLGIPEDAFVLAHAAALTGEKRQRDILGSLSQALERVKGSHDANVHLIIAGTGKLAQTLQTDARQLGIEKNVHFLGFMQDLRPVWSASSAAIFASEAEGLCTALIEAQAAGLPAIITRAGGMVEIVDDGRCGITTAVGDIGALAKAIEQLAGNRDVCNKMGEAAAQNARAKFSADRMVDGVLNVYRELVTEQI
jgi:glycosyltransferase involved in cell wall biosynthesis